MKEKEELNEGGCSSATSKVSDSVKNDNPAYPTAAAIPTQEADHGIRFDFNFGCRVRLPLLNDGKTWRVRLRDLDAGNILFEQGGIPEGTINSSKRWYVRFGIEIWMEETLQNGVISGEMVFNHQLKPKGKNILIQFPVGTLGDTLAWMPYADRFAKLHEARVTCALSGLIKPLFEKSYPDICFLTHEEIVSQNLTETFYATYSLGLFFDDAACDWQPTDFRHVGLHKTAAYILGVSSEESPAKITVQDGGRPVEEPYVCIAVQASSQCKYWNNPSGWRELITWLKGEGYRVICIDQKAEHGAGLVWNHIPHGAEDQTGNRSLMERARWLKHAAFFVGGSSGLAWLAWSAGCPVVMISGFTHPSNEFETPGRIINWHTCNSCWNDPRERFNHHDFLWCPKHKDSERQFECTRLITSEKVINTINNMRGVNK